MLIALDSKIIECKTLLDPIRYSTIILNDFFNEYQYSMNIPTR